MRYISETLYLNIRETLEDFKHLLPRYIEVKNNKELLRRFCSRNRNPIFDITNGGFFKTGLYSEDSVRSESTVEDHIIQRTKAVQIIFKELEKNYEMEVDEFIKVLKKYCSTVTVSKEEHTKVTSMAKKYDDVFNWELYEKCGIFVKGFDELVWKIQDIDEQDRKKFDEQYNFICKHFSPTLT